MTDDPDRIDDIILRLQTIRFALIVIAIGASVAVPVTLGVVGNVIESRVEQALDDRPNLCAPVLSCDDCNSQLETTLDDCEARGCFEPSTPAVRQRPANNEPR